MIPTSKIDTGCSDRLFKQQGNQLLHPYVKPGHSLTKEEHQLNMGAHKGHLEYLENLVPGGRENTYVTRPEVAIGNWWERCCQEKPGFLNSMGRRLSDNLTKCSEYREEISEYAHFFKDYPPDDIRPPVTKAATSCVPFSVVTRHRNSAPPFDNYMSVYSQDFVITPPFKPPYMSGLINKKYRSWIQQILDREVHYCSTYQKTYDRRVYDQQAAPIAKISSYFSVEEEQEAERRKNKAIEVEKEIVLRDKELEKNFPSDWKCGPNCNKDCHYHCTLNKADEMSASPHEYKYGSERDAPPSLIQTPPGIC